MSTANPPRLSVASRRAIAGLVVTQLIGWGTTFNMPAVLGVQIGRDLAMPREFVFGGVGVMLLVAAAISSRIGKRIDSHGGRAVMAAGSLLGGCGLLAMSRSVGPLTWFAAWGILGLAMPMMVSMGAFASLAHLSGRNGRRAIATLMLFTGFSSTVFWPLGGALEAAIGWRATLVVFGMLHLAICLPLHLALIRPGGSAGEGPAEPVDDATRLGLLPAEKRPRALLLLAVALTSFGCIGWGLAMHIIDLIEASGVAATLAIAVGALHGPAQISARFVDWASGNRVAPLALGLGGTILLPVSAAVLLVLPNSVEGAVLFVFLFGVATGMMSIARSTIPLALFGTAGFGALLGRLTMPQNIVFAFSPIVFAAALSRGGAATALWLAIAISLLALGAMLALIRHCRPRRGK